MTLKDTMNLSFERADSAQRNGLMSAEVFAQYRALWQYSAPRFSDISAAGHPRVSVAWRMIAQRDQFVVGYLSAALWLSDPDPGSGEWAEHEGWNLSMVTPIDVVGVMLDCDDFRAQAEAADLTWEDDARAGHDFYLTRNHHGAGFWDRPEYYGGADTARALSALAHGMGDADARAEANRCEDCSADLVGDADGNRVCSADEDHHVDPFPVLEFSADIR